VDLHTLKAGEGAADNILIVKISKSKAAGFSLVE
jgi:hypothetical protein